MQSTVSPRTVGQLSTEFNPRTFYLTELQTLWRVLPVRHVQLLFKEHASLGDCFLCSQKQRYTSLSRANQQGAQVKIVSCLLADECGRGGGQSWMFDRKLNMDSIFHEKVGETFNPSHLSVNCGSDAFCKRPVSERKRPLLAGLCCCCLFGMLTVSSPANQTGWKVCFQVLLIAFNLLFMSQNCDFISNKVSLVKRWAVAVNN